MSKEHITDERVMEMAEKAGFSLVFIAFSIDRLRSLVEQAADMLHAEQPTELPLGAIENGREHARRLVDHYGFTDLADHKLQMCADWIEFVRCFEHLADYALSNAPAAQPVGEPFGWWFTEDPDVFCMPGSGFRRFPDKPQHTVECIALYTTPQPVAVPERVPMTDELEQALEMLVEQCNQDAVFSGAQAVIHAEAVLERLHKSRTDINTPKDASL